MFTPPPPIIISQTERGYYTVAQDGLECRYLCWGEMVEQIIRMTIPTGISRNGYGMKTPDEWREYDARYVQPEESECDDWSSVETHVPF